MTASNYQPPKKAGLIITPPDKRKTQEERDESQRIRLNLKHHPAKLKEHGSNSAFCKMAVENQRQQLYDALHPSINAASSRGVLEAAHADSISLEAINKKLMDTVGIGVTSIGADSLRREVEARAKMAMDASGMSGKAAHVNAVLQEQEAMIRKATGASAIYSVAEAVAPSNSISFASEAEKLSRNSIEGIGVQLSLNSILPKANSKEAREEAKIEALNQQIRESSKRMREMQDQQERRQKQYEERQKEISKQAYLEALREHEAEKQAKEADALEASNVGEPEAKAVDGGDKPIKKRRKRKCVDTRDTTWGVILVRQILDKYGINYLDELPAIKAWGEVISGNFTSNLIKHISEGGTFIELSNGDKLYKTDFSDKYRKQFADEE